MFWDTKDPPSHNIEILLESPDTKLEVFLDEDNIIQECKTNKKNIVNYFTRPDVIKRLIELVTTEPPEDLPMSERFRHANVACEILTMGLPSLDEKLLADNDTLNMLYSYLENEPPLNPLLASFFSKTFSMLFTKKSEQDWFWYQQLCLKLLEYLKTKNNFLDLICKHFCTPIVPDLIMEMMRNVEGPQLKRSLFDWLNEERLIEKLIEIIGDPEQSEKHANVADFLCDLIHQGRTMRQDMDSFEPAFEGSNPILKNIESATTLLALFNVILRPDAGESAIVSGITIVLKIIRPVKLADERNMERLLFFLDREMSIHEEFLTTVIRVIEPQLKQFNELLKNPPKKADILTSAANLSPPFGMTRLQICRLFSELLQTKNEEINKAICETDFLNTLLSLFKEYCWNNFLHCEVEKCFHIIFPHSSSPNVSDAPKDNKEPEQKDNVLDMVSNFEITSVTGLEGAKKTTAVTETTSPSAIQTHAIVNCNAISKLMECWKINKEIESAEKGRRLGYMGHLITIFKHITQCISESEHIGALIENNLKDDSERDLWNSIANKTDGDLTQALNTQNKLLANQEPCAYRVSLDFLITNHDTTKMSDVFNEIFTEMSDTFGHSNDDDEGDEDDNAAATFDSDSGLSFYVQQHLNPFAEDPWKNCDDVSDMMSDLVKNKRSIKPEIGTGFADFEAFFGMGDSAALNPTEATGSGIDTAGLPTTSEEYDNNANVEKSSSWSGDFPSFQVPKKEAQCPTYFKEYDDYKDDEGMWTKPLGNTGSSTEIESSSFQIPKKDRQYSSKEAQYPTYFKEYDDSSNFVDDYEDDEGMWTKPLGGSASSTTVEQSETESVEPINETDDGKTHSISNGPSMPKEGEQLEPEESSLNQLNNSIEDNTLVDQTSEDITSNEIKEENAKELNNDLNIKQEDKETTSKHTSPTNDTSDTETGITPTTTTAIVAEQVSSSDDSNTTVTTTT